MNIWLKKADNEKVAAEGMIGILGSLNYANKSIMVLIWIFKLEK